jgi:replicative DNA helicase
MPDAPKRVHKDIEKSVIALMLLDNSFIDRLKIMFFNPPLLFSDEHYEIVSEILDIYEKQKKVDLVVLKELGKVCREEISYLASLLDLPFSASAFDQYINVLIEDYLANESAYRIQKALTHPDIDIVNTLTEIGSLAIKVKRYDSSIINLSDLVRPTQEYYQKLKKGIVGYSTPWRSMNYVTNGFKKGDLVTIVARTNAGKTWFLLVLLKHLIETKKDEERCFFVSTEISPTTIMFRLSCLMAGVYYDDARRGKLDYISEAKFNNFLSTSEDYLKKKNVYIVSGYFGFSLSALMQAIEDFKPDIIFVDGMYLIKGKGETRHENVSYVADKLKEITLTHNIPVIATTQLNREVRRARMSLYTISTSDVIGWNSDYVFGIEKKEGANDIWNVYTLKSRESECVDFVVSFDLKSCKFDEIQSSVTFVDEDFEEVKEDEDKPF